MSSTTGTFTDTGADPDATTAARPLRADARRNRARVLEAARAAFAADGLDAQMDAVARRAGVGVGTLYRHFPTKAALLEALAADHFAALAVAARRAADGTPDAWDAFAGFMYDAASRAGTDRSVAEILSAAAPAVAESPERAELLLAVDALMDPLRLDGRLRPELETSDVAMLMCAIGQGGLANPDGPAASWERLLAIFLAGVRADRPPPAPLPARRRRR